MSSGVPGRPAPGAEALLRRLEFVVATRLDGLLHGDHQGLLPGPGVEPDEARVYHPGDDVRLIDWNVTARTTVPHVRDPVADRELELWLVVDRSPSLAFGTAHRAKDELALEAAGALALLAGRLGNRVGAVVAGAGEPVTVPARTGRRHLWALVRTVAAAADAPRAPGATDLGAALGRVGRLARRRGAVAVVSDFLVASGWDRAVRALAARHDVLAYEVVDPRELELPDVGPVTFVDPETGALLEVQTARADVRERYAAAAAAQRADIAAVLRRGGADHLQLRTDRDWLLDVVRFVGTRRQRRAALTRRGA